MAETKERLSEKDARQNPLLINAKRREVLLALHAVRFALTRHLVALLDLGPSNASRLLGRLYRHRYLDRMPQLVCHGPGAPALVYMLDILGNEYINDLHGLSAEEAQRRSGRTVSTYFLDHYLAIADIYVALQVAARAAGLRLFWDNEVEAVRLYRQGVGERQLCPDAIFWLLGPQFPTTLVFLEVDRATESLQRWQGKLQDYRGYFSSPVGFLGQHQERPPRVFVLVTTRDAARARSLRKYTAQEWQGQWEHWPFRMGIAVHDHEQVASPQILTLPWTGLDQQLFQLAE